MSKNRRDSSVCELEQRLRDVKSTNCKFRKALMEREAELQALIRKLGPEARAWLDTTLQAQQKGVPPDAGSKERLSVPPIRRELPSTTELTDLTSICSIASTQNELDPLTPSQRYLKFIFMARIQSAQPFSYLSLPSLFQSDQETSGDNILGIGCAHYAASAAAATTSHVHGHADG